MTVTQWLHDFCFPPSKFDLLGSVSDLIDGTCLSNFQQMGPINKAALIRKIMVVALMSRLFCALFYKEEDISLVILVASTIFFAVETSTQGNLKIDFNRLKNPLNRLS